MDERDSLGLHPLQSRPRSDMALRRPGQGRPSHRADDLHESGSRTLASVTNTEKVPIWSGDLARPQRAGGRRKQPLDFLDQRFARVERRVRIENGALRLESGEKEVPAVRSTGGRRRHKISGRGEIGRGFDPEARAEAAAVRPEKDLLLVRW